MLKNAVLDVKKFADGAENEPFEVPKRVGGSGGALKENVLRAVLRAGDPRTYRARI